MGAEAIQVFISSPQGWAMKPVPEEQAERFRARAGEAGIGPVFLHAIYLINLGSESQEHLEKSAGALVHYMRGASAIGAAGVIFHAGSHRGRGFDGVLRQAVDTLARVLEQSPPDVWLIIENSAGMGDHIGSSFQQVGRIMKALDDPRVHVCLDTQHCFAAGYDLTTGKGLEGVVAEFDREVGLEHLVAVHANDSRYPLGAGVDRHENIGEGHLGLDAFELIMAHPALGEVPFLLEVPGFENQGPDKENVDRLKAIRERLGIPA